MIDAEVFPVRTVMSCFADRVGQKRGDLLKKTRRCCVQPVTFITLQHTRSAGSHLLFRLIVTCEILQLLWMGKVPFAFDTNCTFLLLRYIKDAHSTLKFKPGNP